MVQTELQPFWDEYRAAHTEIDELADLAMEQIAKVRLILLVWTRAHQKMASGIVDPADWFDITIHQHMPMFHMEHCVFCAFLSDGTDFTNCGRPCDTHEVKLRDRVGTEHILQADAGCRNTLFNGKAQTGCCFNVF